MRSSAARRRRADEAHDERDQRASASATSTSEVAVPQRVEDLAERASGGVVGAPGVLVVRERLVPHAVDAQGQCGHDVHADRDRRGQRGVAHARRAAAATAARSARRSPRAGTDSALIDTAPPAASPIHDRGRAGAGRRGSASAKATASTESASDGPSAFTGPVTQRTEPLVVTSPAASSALPRVVTSARARVDRDVSEHAGRDARAAAARRGCAARRGRRARRAAGTPGPGWRRCRGTAARPLRIASADDANTPSSNTSDFVARRTPGCAARSPRPRGPAASVRQCAAPASARPGERRRVSTARRTGCRHPGTVSKVRSVAGARGCRRVVVVRVASASDFASTDGREQGLGEAHLRDRWCGVEPREGPHRLVARAAAQEPGPAGHDAEARPLHQRRSRAR